MQDCIILFIYVKVVSYNLKIRYCIYEKISLLKCSIYRADCRQTLRILKNLFFRHRIYAMKWTIGVSRSRYGVAWGGGGGVG